MYEKNLVNLLWKKIVALLCNIICGKKFNKTQDKKNHQETVAGDTVQV